MDEMITSKQRAALRAMANTMQLNDALEGRELIKMTVLEAADVSAREAIEILSERLHAEPVQCIGRKIVLYRRAKENPKIEL